MQPVKIILSGCSGKMGRAVTEMAQAQENLSIIAGVDNFPAAHAYPVFSDFEQLNITGDVIIDFSGGLFASFINYIIYSFKNKKINFFQKSVDRCKSRCYNNKRSSDLRIWRNWQTR